VTIVATRARWEAYAAATRADHFAWWCAEHCVQSVGQFAGRPLELEPWQVEMMGEALAEDAADDSYWVTVALVIPKKNGKTSMLAAFGLYHLLEDEAAPEILLAAATDKQAGRLFDTAVRFVRSDPWLSARLVVREHEGQIARADGFGSLYRVSADSGAAAGYGPSLVVADELADWTTPRRRRTWGNIATAGQMVREQVYVFVISTAGEPAERVDGILGQLIDRNELDGETERVHPALTISRNHPGRTLVYNYDARTHDLGDMTALKAANPASWISEEKLAELAANPSLTPGRFLQLHGCVWVAAEAGYLDLETWQGLATEAELEPGDEIAVGFRGADSCALVACRRRDNLLVTLDVWEQTGAGIDFVAVEDVDDAVRAAIIGYRVASIYVSATAEWQTTAQEWRNELGRKRVVDVDIARPSPKTAAITQRFKADAVTGRFRHDGDRRLARHMMSAQVARTRNLPYLVGDTRGGSIAAALAAVLAWEANVLADPGADDSDRSEFAFL
jgi:hypothetical protein